MLQEPAGETNATNHAHVCTWLLPKHDGYLSLRSWNAARQHSRVCELCTRTAIGTAPALVAVRSTVAVLPSVSQEDVESTNMMSCADSSLWARCMMGVTTTTAQQSLAILVEKTPVPAYIHSEKCLFQNCFTSRTPILFWQRAEAHAISTNGTLRNDNCLGSLQRNQKYCVINANLILNRSSCSLCTFDIVVIEQCTKIDVKKKTTPQVIITVRRSTALAPQKQKEKKNATSTAATEKYSMQ